MIDLPPFLLGLAFVLVGAAAWYIGRRSAVARTVRLPRDYYVGLEHLINDRIDHAAEVFSRMAEAEGDKAEIQFALGSLFRRRGEVDRAIALHARSLTFLHPVRYEPITLVADLPAGWRGRFAYLFRRPAE